MEVRPIELMGQRVRLQPLEMRHAEGLFHAGNNLEIWSYMSRKILTLDDMKHLVEEALRAQEQGSELPFVILDQVSGHIVGSTRYLEISKANRNLEIGWTWLSPEVWRTKVNTECKYLLLRHAFEHLGVIRVQWKTDKRNIRSQQAIERLGAVKEGVLRNHRILSDGYVRDSVHYSVIDQEWPSVKMRLEHMLEK